VRRKGQEQPGATEVGSTAPSTASAMMTPLDIQQKEFQVSRLGGYRMRDVDEFLDQLTDAMTAVLAENERLRSGASGSPLVGSPDLDEVSRQADEIIQRARDEAARIVAEANERAASMAGHVASGSVSEADRAAVDAFLARERAFLQSLAALVQEHADGVKGMAREVRRRSPQPSTGVGAAEQRPAEAAPPAAAGATAAAAPVVTERPAANRTDVELQAEPATGDRASADPASSEPASSEPASVEPDREPEATRPIAPVPAADEPIVVSEPEPARARRDDEGGDESLRELFWGEES
jgi:DivIVA domain-containing protein